MSSDVRFNRRVRATAAKDVFHALWAATIPWFMASSVVAAQEGSTSTTNLPEIHVIATTPVAPPRVPPRAPAAAAAPTPARTSPCSHPCSNPCSCSCCRCRP